MEVPLQGHPCKEKNRKHPRRRSLSGIFALALPFTSGGFLNSTSNLYIDGAFVDLILGTLVLPDGGLVNYRVVACGRA